MSLDWCAPGTVDSSLVRVNGRFGPECLADYPGTPPVFQGSARGLRWVWGALAFLLDPANGVRRELSGDWDQMRAPADSVQPAALLPRRLAGMPALCFCDSRQPPRRSGACILLSCGLCDF